MEGELDEPVSAPRCCPNGGNEPGMRSVMLEGTEKPPVERLMPSPRDESCERVEMRVRGCGRKGSGGCL